MALLTSIEWKRALITLSFDDGWKVILTRDVFYELNLHENESYDPEELKQKIILHQYRPALNKAVSMLALRACSKKEIEDRLTRFHYLADTTELVIYKLEKEGFLDDQEFARQWVDSRVSQGKYGRNRISFELRKKGLSQEAVDEIMEETDPDQEFSSALRLAEKSFKKMDDLQERAKQKRKIYGMLARRGFDPDVIHQVFDVLFTEE